MGNLALFSCFLEVFSIWMWKYLVNSKRKIDATVENFWSYCEKNSRESTVECCMMEWDGSLV